MNSSMPITENASHVNRVIDENIISEIFLSQDDSQNYILDLGLLEILLQAQNQGIMLYVTVCLWIPY